METTERFRKVASRLARSAALFRILRLALNGRFAPVIASRLRPHFHGRVLDIGCATGELAHFIRAPYVGVDNDAVFLPLARREVREGWVLAADGLRLPFRDGAFGTAIVVQALHHLPDDEARAILREAGRCAGRVLVVDLIVPPRRKRLRRFFHDVDRGRHMRDLAGLRGIVGGVLPLSAVERFRSPSWIYEYALLVAGGRPPQRG